MESTRTRLSFCTTFPSIRWWLLRHAVVPLKGAVVPLSPDPVACACGSRRGCNFLHLPSCGSTVMNVRYYRAGLLHCSTVSGGRHGSNFLLPCIFCARCFLLSSSTATCSGSTTASC